MVSRMVPVLEIGGTHLTVAVVDSDKWRVVGGTVSRRELDADAATPTLVAAVTAAVGSLSDYDGGACGVAVPGPFDYARGIGDFRGVGKLGGLRGVDLGDVVGRTIRGGAAGVHFVNDAEAFALGEWVAGAACGHRRAIGVTLGTGVGSAFLADGTAQHRGRGVPPQGRLDLVEIAGHRLEDTISRRAIRDGYAALNGAAAEGLDVLEIAALARSGDVDARRAIDAPLRALGQEVAPRAVHFDASVVVVGGSIAMAWDVIDAPLRAGMSVASPGWSDRFALVPARRNTEAALIGAAWHALARL